MLILTIPVSEEVFITLSYLCIRFSLITCEVAYIFSRMLHIDTIIFNSQIIRDDKTRYVCRNLLVCKSPESVLNLSVCV